jgi:hypothetical protein
LLSHPSAAASARTAPQQASVSSQTTTNLSKNLTGKNVVSPTNHR